MNVNGAFLLQFHQSSVLFACLISCTSDALLAQAARSLVIRVVSQQMTIHFL